LIFNDIPFSTQIKIGIRFGIRFLILKYAKICAFLIALSGLKECQKGLEKACFVVGELICGGGSRSIGKPPTQGFFRQLPDSTDKAKSKYIKSVSLICGGGSRSIGKPPIKEFSVKFKVV